MRVRFEDTIWRRVSDGDDFDESKVNRNQLGEFAKKGAEPVVFGKHEKSRTKMLKEHRAKTTEEFYGEELPGNRKGRNAVMQMLQERRGYIRGAFHRPDIGDIDLVWGDTEAGLCHIIDHRVRNGQSVKDVVYGISTTLANGDIELDRTIARSASIRYGKMRVIVSMGFKGGEAKLVVTSYEVETH